MQKKNKKKEKRAAILQIIPPYYILLWMIYIKIQHCMQMLPLHFLLTIVCSCVYGVSSKRTYKKKTGGKGIHEKKNAKYLL